MSLHNHRNKQQIIEYFTNFLMQKTRIKIGKNKNL